MKPDFSKIDFKDLTAGVNPPGAAIKPEQWQTHEQIPLQNFYTAADTVNFEHLNFAAGLPPYLRGPYSTMYVKNPWTIRQYAGFSTAEESNAFYRRN